MCSVPAQETSLHRKLSKPDEQSARRGGGEEKMVPLEDGSRLSHSMLECMT